MGSTDAVGSFMSHASWQLELLPNALFYSLIVLARPAAESRPVGYMFCCCFFFFIYFNDSCQTNYMSLKIDGTNLCEIFRVGRTMAVDDLS